MKIANLKSECLFAILFLALPLQAQMFPDEPKPHLDRAGWMLLASDAGARALDTYSTRWALSNGNRELFLPAFVANNTPVLAAFEGSMVTLNYFAARRLERHHRFFLAHVVVAADAMSVYPWAIHNLMLPKTRH